MTERERIEREISHVYHRINVLLRANEPEQANRLRDQIPELERQKANLRYIKE